MKFIAILIFLIPLVTYGQVKTEFQKEIENEIQQSKENAIQMQGQKLYMDSMNVVNEKEQIRKDYLKKLNKNSENKSLTITEPNSPIDSLLSRLRPLGNIRISTDPNVVPQGFTPGDYEVKDTSKMMADFKLPEYLGQKENKKKSQTLIITVIISFLIIGAIVLLVKKSINGNNPKQ